MNCRNCGAPMELYDRRRYYFCTHCGSFHFIDVPPLDEVRVLDRSGDRPCPRCAATLARSVLDDAYNVEHCERCRGLLIERAQFVDAVTRRRGRAGGPGTPPAPLDRRELEHRVPCPSCRGRMDVHPYYGPGNVVIDTCTPCSLIWLDSGELQQITDAPGRDRGRPRSSEAGSPARPARSGPGSSLSEVLTLFDVW
jgi:Zn-finger nucleic acid-binding protein/DNA-directed RNA polymerase subunit RPC12/RpoP